MKHTRVVSTKCSIGLAYRAFSDTTLVYFIVNGHNQVFRGKCKIAVMILEEYFIKKD